MTNNTYLAQAGILGSALGLLLGAAAMLLISRNYAYMMSAIRRLAVRTPIQRSCLATITAF
ncbi:MAG: hypothetical protein IJ664_05550 [Clostridia bacterium]|nr:hypothetical protein [Clostridia bacterium]